jgi:hypothetical protein
MVDTRVAELENLPVQLAIRLVLDDIAYSNPLPSWVDPIVINYSRRELAIRQKLQQYATQSTAPRPFSILVPKKSGQKRLWSVPSVNEQIMLQACISSFAEKLDGDVLDNRVFSYRYNRQEDQLGLVEDQLAAWTKFQDETKRRCQNSQCMLQIDLQNAFQSIDRGDLYKFLADFTTPLILGLLRRHIDSFSFEAGLPLVNNSVFFLGNAYLSKIDTIIQRHNSEFVRFVDDYRIFDSSKGHLESVLRRITVDLERAGYYVNPDKLRLGTGQEYLEAVSKLKYSPDTDEGGYVRPTVLRDLMRREDIVQTISMSVNDPDKYLNEGFGRFQLAVMRRFRFNQNVARKEKPKKGDEEEEEPSTLEGLLSEDSELVNKIIELLHRYSKDPTEIWRTIWLLYVLKIVDLDGLRKRDASTAARFQEGLLTLQASTTTGIAARLWSNPKAGVLVQGEDIEKLHDLNYIDSGMLHCKD